MLTLRISSGTAKNKKLKLPNIENFRAVQEIAKQAIFSIIADKINNARCLDLFAGSGNMGIEALSRGAEWCDFVDSHYEAITTIEQNLFNCGFSDKAAIHQKDAAKFAAAAVSSTNDKYDLIFMDPFYEDTAQVYLLKQVDKVLTDNGLAFMLYGSKLNIATIIKDTNLEVVTTRRFGATHFSELRHKA